MSDQNTTPSLIEEVLAAPLPKVVSSKEKPVAKVRANVRKKMKPYQQLAQSDKVNADRNAEKKAAKAGTASPKKSGLKQSKKAAVSEAVSSVRRKIAETLTGKGAKVKVNKQQTSQASANGSGKCSVCGKLLSRHSSVVNGMGETCAAQLKKLPAGYSSLKEHYQSYSVTDEPGKDYIKLKEAVAIARSKGVSLYRFLIAVGGNRMLRPPLNKNFQIVVFKNTRYVPKASVTDKELKPLRK